MLLSLNTQKKSFFLSFIITNLVLVSGCDKGSSSSRHSDQQNSSENEKTSKQNLENNKTSRQNLENEKDPKTKKDSAKQYQEVKISFALDTSFDLSKMKFKLVGCNILDKNNELEISESNKFLIDSNAKDCGFIIMNIKHNNVNYIDNNIHFIYKPLHFSLVNENKDKEIFLHYFSSYDGSTNDLKDPINIVIKEIKIPVIKDINWDYIKSNSVPLEGEFENEKIEIDEDALKQT